MDGDYWPRNLQWADATEQSGNRRITHAYRATEEALSRDACLCPGTCPGTRPDELLCPERSLFRKLMDELPGDLSPFLAQCVTAAEERERQGAEAEERVFEPFTRAHLELGLADLEP